MPKQNNNFKDLWEQHRTPAADMVTNIPGQLSSINSYYMLEQATEAFGPCGKGWGYTVTADEMIVGAPIFKPGTFDVIANTLTHKLTINFWYKLNGHKYFISHTGITPYVFWCYDFASIHTDHEAPKKSLTDAIKKCLSVLGFCADIYQQTIYDDPASNDKTATTQVSAQQPQTEAANDSRDLEHERISGEINRYIDLKIPDIQASKGVIRQGQINNLIKEVEGRCHVAHIPTQAFIERIEKEAA